jgi:hypothetical protein
MLSTRPEGEKEARDAALLRPGITTVRVPISGAGGASSGGRQAARARSSAERAAFLTNLSVFITIASTNGIYLLPGGSSALFGKWVYFNYNTSRRRMQGFCLTFFFSSFIIIL